MDLFRASERLTGLDDRGWARHASPWSVYSRFTALPLLALAVWSRVWIGAWAWAAVGAVLAWIWLNPRVFPPPSGPPGWAAKGTFGERLFLDRQRVPIPARHRDWAIGLSAVAAAGLLPFGWGLWRLDPGVTLFGLAVTMGTKAWFVDRMVFLYEEMSREGAAPEARRR